MLYNLQDERLLVELTQFLGEDPGLVTLEPWDEDFMGGYYVAPIEGCSFFENGPVSPSEKFFAHYGAKGYRFRFKRKSAATQSFDQVDLLTIVSESGGAYEIVSCGDRHKVPAEYLV